MGTHIFLPGECFCVSNILKIPDQTYAIWIPVFVSMPSSQYTIWDNEIKPVTSQYIEEHHAIDPKGLSQRRRSGKLISDLS
jgi:hypothetical protein